MKRIATAMGNPTLNNELKKYIEYDVVGEDLFYQDAVIDLLEIENIEILTLSGLLQGQWELNEFIDKVRKINSNIRIIIVMDEIDSEIKCGLLERNVQDIFLDDTVEIKDIINSINREEPLKTKLQNEKIKVCEKVAREYCADEKVVVVRECQKQEIISISGVNGAGKSTVAFNMSKRLKEKSDSKILVIDFDTLSGNIDEIFDINKIPQNVELNIDADKKCGLNYAADLINKNRFDANVLEEIVVNKNGIDILTGNTSLYYCQEVLNESIYDAILEAAKEKYDFIILDTSSNIFLDSTRWCLQKATKIIFVIENNYLNLKKASQLLDVMVKTWGILKSKISMLINKECFNGLSVELIENIFEDYKVLGKIKNGNSDEEIAYDKILENIKFVPKTKLKDRITNITNGFKKLYDKKLISQREVIVDAN